MDKKEDGTEEWVRVGEPVTMGADGIAAFDGFTDDKFRVVETAAPAGYIGSFVSPEFIAQGLSTEGQAQSLLNDAYKKTKGARIEYRNGAWDIVRGLKGAKFELHEGGVNGKVIQELVTGEDGYAYITETIDPKKDYVLVETEAVDCPC